jgi:hypothetical protein
MPTEGVQITPVEAVLFALIRSTRGRLPARLLEGTP